jgi:hypothetical protein
MSYRYYAGAVGARFCYAVQPTYLCPLGEPDLEAVEAPWQAAARELGCSPVYLAREIRRAHRSHRIGRERDADGKLTDRCTVCGARMERHGFAAWSEAPDPEEYRQRIADRLGFAMAVVQSTPRRYFERKREAMEWAREESKISRAAAVE